MAALQGSRSLVTRVAAGTFTPVFPSLAIGSVNSIQHRCWKRYDKRVNVILTEDVPGVGHRGQEKSVRPGFARNSLLGKSAVTANETSRAKFADVYEAEAEKSADEVALQRLKAKVQKSVVVMKRHVVKGKEMSAITPENVSEKMFKQHLISVAAENIAIETKIDKLGTHNLKVTIDGDAIPMQLKVVPR